MSPSRTLHCYCGHIHDCVSSSICPIEKLLPAPPFLTHRVQHQLPSIFQSILPLRIFLLVSNTLILGFLHPQPRAHIQLLPDLRDPLVKDKSEPDLLETRELRNMQCKAPMEGPCLEQWEWDGNFILLVPTFTSLHLQIPDFGELPAQLLTWSVSLIPKCLQGSQGMQTLYPALSQMSEHKQPKALVCSSKHSAWPYSTSFSGKPSPGTNKQTNLASWKQAVMLQLISTLGDHKSAWKENSGCCFGKY